MEELRTSEKNLTRKKLGLIQRIDGKFCYAQGQLAAYKKELQQNLITEIEFGLRQDNQIDPQQVNPPEIKDDPLWQVMVRIYQEAPEVTKQQQISKFLAITAIQALIFLKLNKEYAAMLAYIYSIEKEFIDSGQMNLKDAAFYQLRVDHKINLPQERLIKDVLTLRSYTYYPDSSIVSASGIEPKLVNHLEYYLRFNNDSGGGEPWRQQEVLAKLEEDLENQSLLIAKIIDPRFKPQEQNYLLRNFVDKVSANIVGCAAGRLQESLAFLSRAAICIKDPININELVSQVEFSALKNYLNLDPPSNDPKSLAKIYLNLLMNLEDQTIDFSASLEQDDQILVSPENYQYIVDKIKHYLINIGVLEEEQDQTFYSSPENFWLFNYQNIPDLSMRSKVKLNDSYVPINIVWLEFDTEQEAKCAMTILKYFFTKNYNPSLNFFQITKIHQNPSEKFFINLSESDYNYFLLRRKEILQSNIQSVDSSANPISILEPQKSPNTVANREKVLSFLDSEQSKATEISKDPEIQITSNSIPQERQDESDPAVESLVAFEDRDPLLASTKLQNEFFLANGKIDPDRLNRYLASSTILSLNEKLVEGKLKYVNRTELVDPSQFNNSNLTFLGRIEYIDSTQSTLDSNNIVGTANTKIIANVFNSENSIKLNFPPKADGSIELLQQDWAINFFKNLPVTSKFPLIATVSGFKPEDVIEILNKIDQINRNSSNQQILLKFVCEDDLTEFASVKAKIDLHNQYIDQIIHPKLSADDSLHAVPKTKRSNRI